MGQRLIEVEDNSLADTGLREGKLDHAGLDLLVADGRQSLQEADGLEDVDGELAEDGPPELLVLERGLLVDAVEVLAPYLVVVVREDVVRHGRGEGRNQAVELDRTAMVFLLNLCWSVHFNI